MMLEKTIPKRAAFYVSVSSRWRRQTKHAHIYIFQHWNEYQSKGTNQKSVDSCCYYSIRCRRDTVSSHISQQWRIKHVMIINVMLLCCSLARQFYNKMCGDDGEREFK